MEQVIREWITASYPAVYQLLDKSAATAIDARIAELVISSQTTWTYLVVLSFLAILGVASFIVGLYVTAKGKGDDEAGIGMCVASTILGGLFLILAACSYGSYYETQGSILALQEMKKNPIAVHFGGRP